MPEHRALVDVEKLARAYLAADDELLVAFGAASAATAPVMSELDDTYDPGSSWVLQVFRVSSTDVASSHVERAVVQMNAYAPTKGDAWSLWALADVVARAAPAADHEAAVVTAVERISGPTWSPDPTTDGPRYVSSYAYTVHPASASPG